MANTTNLLLSAKSTRARIICGFPVLPAAVRAGSPSPPRSELRSLSEHVVEDQGVCNYLLSGLQPGLDLLQVHIVREEISAGDFDAAELVARRGNVDKIPIVHVQNGGCRDDGVYFPGLTVEGGSHEH